MVSLIAHLVCVAFVFDVANCFSINGNRHFVRSNHALRFEKQSQIPLLESKRRITGRLSMVTTDRPAAAALPRHKELVEGKLGNGFSYVILPNSVPAGRFEAHLEVLSGSAHELDQQQGAATFTNFLVVDLFTSRFQLLLTTGNILIYLEIIFLPCDYRYICQNRACYNLIYQCTNLYVL
jgi:hypothetical protein